MANVYDNAALQPDTDHESTAQPPPYSDTQTLPLTTGESAPYPPAPSPTNYPGMAPTVASSGALLPYYPPQVTYPPPGYYPQPFPMQTTNIVSAPPQQQPVVLINTGQPATGAVQRQPVDSYAGQIVFSCLVTWLCNILFGTVAFILAMVAKDKAASDRKAARKLGNASVGVSIVGIVVSVIIVAVVVGVVLALAATDCRYQMYGSSNCYEYRVYATSSISCYSNYGYSSAYDNNCCYTNSAKASSASSTYFISGRCYRYKTYGSSYTRCRNYYGYSSYYDYPSNACYYNYVPTTTTTPPCVYHRFSTCYRYRVYATSSSICYRNYGYSSKYDDNCCYTNLANASGASSTYFIAATGRCHRYKRYASSSSTCRSYSSTIYYHYASYSSLCYYN